MGERYIGPVGWVPVGQFAKKIARLMGRIGSVPRLVRWLESGVRVSAVFKKCLTGGLVRVRTPPRGRSTGSIRSSRERRS